MLNGVTSNKESALRFAGALWPAVGCFEIGCKIPFVVALSHVVSGSSLRWSRGADFTLCLIQKTVSRQSMHGGSHINLQPVMF